MPRSRALPRRARAHFHSAACAEPSGYAQRKQGLEDVDELAQGLATNAITLKVWVIPSRAPACPCIGPVLSRSRAAVCLKQQKAKQLLERSQDQGADLPALVTPRVCASHAASDVAARLLHGACVGASGHALRQDSLRTASARPAADAPDLGRLRSSRRCRRHGRRAASRLHS